MLEEKFKRELIDGAHYVDWRAFCKTISEALLVSNLEVKPSVTPEVTGGPHCTDTPNTHTHTHTHMHTHALSPKRTHIHT